MTIDQAVREVVREELAAFKAELIAELTGNVQPTADVPAEVESPPKKKRPSRAKKKVEQEAPVVDDQPITDGTEVEPEPVSEVAPPPFADTDEFLAGLMKLINGPAKDKADKLARKTKALGLLKEEFSFDRFSEVPSEDFSEVYEKVEIELG